MVKFFEPFEDVSNHSHRPSIDSMMISYGFSNKKSSKLVMNRIRVETIKEARKEYKQLLEEGWKDTIIFKS